MKYFLQSIVTSILLLATALLSTTNASDIHLPELTNDSSRTISLEKEYELGRVWLKAFRSRTKEFSDPETQQYVEELIDKLTVHSELKDRRLEVIVVDNPTMNAFAVPGGIIGIHTGLFTYAENEHQIASVFTHELAHISQRHFARRLAEQKKSSITSMAGLLAGLVLAATSNGDAGIAAITATQSIAQNKQLRYSRQNEQEADRLGMENLHKAGMDPAAAPAMFERMSHASRFSGQHVPEFLRTHPLTEKRISDTQLRVRNYEKKDYTDNLQYHLIRSRIQLHLEGTQLASKRFRSQLKGTTKTPPEAARYGLMLALIENEQLAQAKKQLDILLATSDQQLYQLARLDLLIAEKNYEDALQLAQKQLVFHPNDYALNIKISTIHTKAQQYQQADKLLTKMSRKRPTDPQIWYQLAEIRGLAGNIVALHQARAEYFILVGNFEMARNQLNQAEKLSRHDFQKSSIIKEKLIELVELEKAIEKL